MTSNIPTFASFRPKPKSASDAIPISEPSKRTRRSENKGESAKEKNQSDKKSTSEPDKLLSTKPFFSDRRGDPEVLRYGNLNSYDIPAYRRYGSGCVLGLAVHERIDRESSTEKKIYIKSASHQERERLLTKRYLNKSSERSLRLIATGEQYEDWERDFIPLSRIGKRKRSFSSDQNERKLDLDYRGVDQARDSDDTADPDTQYESDAHFSRVDKEVTRQNAEFLRKTREYPEDLEGWLALIDHQESMLKLDRPSAELGASDKVHLADVRIAIYEEALKKFGKDQLNLRELYKGLLGEAQKSWDASKLAAKWKEVLPKFPESVDLWLMYLDFHQSNFATFKFETCRSTFFECLKVSQSDLGDDSSETKLYILLRLTSMIQESGYQELSLSIWQAVLEFHLMRPPAGDETNLQDRLKSFEEFWESEVPRIGESKAKGWRNHNMDDPLAADISTSQKLGSSSSDLEHFSKHEKEAMTIFRYPGRALDDSGEDDAFHVIFFSDIVDYLKILPHNVPNTMIIEAFLCFCGLPPLGQATLHQQRWRSDPFLQRQFHPGPYSSPKASGFLNALERFSTCPIQSFQMTSELLFEQDFSLENAKLSADFMRWTLRILALWTSGNKVVGEYYLAFELFHFPDEVHKTAKALLKAHPSSLQLYNAYGLVESYRDKFTKADQVFSMALSMQTENVYFSIPGSLELFSNWVWAAVRQEKQTEALWRLLSPHGRVSERAAHKERPDEGALLRAEALLSETSERFLLAQDFSSAVISTSLFALLTYLVRDLDVTPALAIHKNLSAWFKSHKLSQASCAELHAQSVARLLTHHVTHSPIFKPALLRTTISPLISDFPGNTLLLALFAANEARFSVDDRVRSIMRQSSLRNSDTASIVAWTFSVHYEILRGELAGSTSHSVRALYKRATDLAGAHCPGFWKSYFEFELDQLRKEYDESPDLKSSKSRKKSKWTERRREAEQRTRDVFYAGLRKLPWCKDYIMMAFTESLGLFDKAELAQLYRVFQEKELRLYIEIDVDV